MADQCALGPDGMLLDASQITFFHDPDDRVPLPPVPTSAIAGPENAPGRTRRSRNTTRMAEILQAEKEDVEGNTAISATSKPQRRRRKKTKDANPSPSDVEDRGDDDFELESTETESEVASEEDEAMVTNEELAAFLPSKTVPLTSAGATANRKTTTQVSSSKRKANALPADSSITKRARVCDATDPKPASDSTTIKSTEPQNVVEDSSFSISSLMNGKRNYIYLFYERVDADDKGNSQAGYKYYKCFHGQRKTYTISPNMKHNIKNMVQHLQNQFPTMHKLYNIMSSRKTPPTPLEVLIATKSSTVSEKEVSDYLRTLDAAPQATLPNIFLNQTAALWDQAEFERLLTEWIIACDQPFDQVEHPAFKSLLNYVHLHSRKPLSIPGRTTVQKRVMKMGQDTIEETQKMFAELECKVSISLDGWTSSNQYAFLALVAHYITNDGDLEELLIEFKELIGQHTGENMAEAVWATLELYKLTDKIIAFVMDNASNNDTMIESIEAKCTQRGIPFSAKHARGRCMPHTIHLAAIQLLEQSGAISASDAKKSASHVINYQDSVTELFGDESDDAAVLRDDEEEDVTELASNIDISAIHKLRKIVRGVRVTPQRRQAWSRSVQLTRPEVVESAKGDHIPLMLILDCRTRWSSTHQMLERVFKFEQAVNHFVAMHKDLCQYALSNEDWNNLKLLKDWLRLFREASTQMSTTSSPMLSTTHAIFRGLQDELKSILRSLPDDVSPELKRALLNAHRKLSDYFYKFDLSPYPLWAALLDPRIGYAGLKDDYTDDPDLLDGLEQSKVALESHFNQFYAGRASLASTTTPQSLVTDLSSDNPQPHDFTARFRKRPKPLQNELEEFFSLFPQDFTSCNPVQWWYSNRNRFPNLYRLARDILAIPGSAVAVERIFSGGRDTISLRRASLKPDTIRILMLVKQRIRMRQS